jgi:TonB family protein
MLNAKNIIAMLLAAILAAACKDSNKKNELPPAEEYSGWSGGCSEGEGDAEWPHGSCNYGDDTLKKVYVASTYALLSNPKLFEKKLVHTCGYLTGDVIVEDCSIESSLYPSREDALDRILTNRLTLYVKKGTEVFRHMELPYEFPVCVIGMFSSYVPPSGRSYVPDFGIIDASIFILNHEKRWTLEKLNNKLDSLLKEGKDISEFQWSDSCEKFEIKRGRIKPVDVSPNCPDYYHLHRNGCLTRVVKLDSLYGSRSERDIILFVNSLKRELDSKYINYIELKPKFSGKVRLKFTIAPDGDISSISIVSSTTGNAEFDNVVKDVFAKWTMWGEGGNTTVVVTLEFKPDYIYNL